MCKQKYVEAWCTMAHWVYTRWTRLQIYLDSASNVISSVAIPFTKPKVKPLNIGSHTDCHWKVTEYVFEAVYTLACVEPEGTVLA